MVKPTPPASKAVKKQNGKGKAKASVTTPSQIKLKNVPSKATVNPKKSKVAPNGASENAMHVKFFDNGKVSKVANPRPLNDLIVPEHLDGFWYEDFAKLQKLAMDKSGDYQQNEEPDQVCRDRATHLYEAAVVAFENKKKKSKDADSSILRGLLTKGTMEDQISALAVATEESPVHLAGFTISRLLGIARKKSREHSWLALEALRDVFAGCLLPENRRLRAWDSQEWNIISPRLSREEGDMWMVYRVHEDKVKTFYSEVITILETSCSDPVEWFRIKALGLVQELLCARPEGEVRLLSILVNKIGDPTRKVCSRAHRLISAIFDTHPNMKSAVVSEVERFLFRSNITVRAQFQAVVLLSQIRIAHYENALARKLVDLYLSLFTRHDLETDSRLLSALLTGLNRSFPFALSLMNEEAYDAQTDRLFKLARSNNFNAAIQALMLLSQVMNARQSLSDRFYTTLYESMLSPHLQHSSKHSLYLNLLFRTMKNDVSLPRIAAFAKRLLQLCLCFHPGFICGALFLLSEVAKVHSGLWVLIGQPAASGKDGMERFNGVDDSPSDADLKAQQYDPKKRNPQYSNANLTCFWELIRLSHHHHPSVEKFSKQLLLSSPISYQGNPIQDFSLSHFLDRFIYRNPKKQSGPVSHLAPKVSKLLVAPVNTEKFWNAEESNIRDDEVFIHRYFRQRIDRGELTPNSHSDIQHEDNDAEVDQFADELFENELAKVDGPVDIDEDEEDYQEDSDGSVLEADEMMDCSDDGMLSDGEDDDEIPQTTKSSKKQTTSRFVDAADFAELLELTSQAAKENSKVDKWQNRKQSGNKQHRKSKRENNKSSSARSHKKKTKQ